MGYIWEYRWAMYARIYGPFQKWPIAAPMYGPNIASPKRLVQIRYQTWRFGTAFLILLIFVPLNGVCMRYMCAYMAIYGASNGAYMRAYMAIYSVWGPHMGAALYLIISSAPSAIYAPCLADHCRSVYLDTARGVSPNRLRIDPRPSHPRTLPSWIQGLNERQNLTLSFATLCLPTVAAAPVERRWFHFGTS